MRSLVLRAAVLVTAAFACPVMALDAVPEPPSDLATPVASMPTPPLGFDPRVPQVMPIVPEARRPAAVSLGLLPLCVPLGGKLTLRASVVDQFGDPAPDGTVVVFMAAAGTLASSSAPTKGGVAETTLTATLEGPAMVTAAAGFLNATAVAHVRPAGEVAAASIIDDPLMDSAGAGAIRGGTFQAGTGVRLTGDEGGRQGITYRTTGLAAGRLGFVVRGLGPASTLQGLVCLLLKREGADKAGGLVDLRRVAGPSGEKWSLRAAGTARAADRAAARPFDPSLAYAITVTWSPERLTAYCRVVGGDEVFSMSAPVRGVLPRVERVVVGGHPSVAGPSGVVVTGVTLSGR